MTAILTAPQPDLIAEANHRVANSLTLLSGLVRMQARHVGRTAKSYSGAEVRLMFDGFAARISTIGQLHRMLAHLPPDGTVDIAQHLRDLSGVLVAAFSTDQQQVEVRHHSMNCHVLARNVQPLTLIVCEIITNAIKYAHPSGVPVQIDIRCEDKGNGDLLVTVSDDGVGLPEGFDTRKDGGIGFQIIRTLTGEMGAHLDVSSDNLGATFHLTIPQTLVANAQTA
jgi:two-component sensor histidine kinase